MTCVSVRRPCYVRGDSCVAGRRRNPALDEMCIGALTVLRKGKLLRGRSSPESCARWHVCPCVDRAALGETLAWPVVAGILRCVSVRRPCCVRGSSCVAGRRRNPVCVCRCIRASTVLRKGKLLRRCVCAYCVYIYIYITCICIYIYLFIYEIPSKFALIKSLLECASDGGRRMKSVQTRGNSQKRCFFCLRMLARFGVWA